MLGNMAYFHLTLSFLQMVKALSPAVLFFILYLTGLDKWHAKVAMAVTIEHGGRSTILARVEARGGETDSRVSADEKNVARHSGTCAAIRTGPWR